MSAEVLVTLDKVRSALKKRGAKTIAGLGRSFRCMDSFDGNKKVDSQEFYVGLTESGVDITQDEANQLLTFFDKDGDGHVNFDEFLVGIRGKPNEKRQAMVDKAFLKFDKDGSGYIDRNDLHGVYDVSMHPKFQTGEMTEDEIFNEFLANFNDRDGDGKIVKDEWDEYYAAISSNIDNDDHFVLLMRNAWKLD